ncbi:MAG: hypothetical protein ACI4T1_00625 [Christensenellales bacterium]
MIFKNTFKLLFTNFSLTYKVLIYKLLVFFVGFGVFIVIAEPTLSFFKSVGFISFMTDEMTIMFGEINLTNIFVCCKNILFEFIDVVKIMDANILINIILSSLSFLIIYGILSNFSELAVLECLNSNMSSKTKLSFAKELISKIYKSFLMIIVRFILSLIFIVALAVVTYYSFVLYDKLTGIEQAVIPALYLVVLIILLSLQLVTFAGFSPSIIVNDDKILNCLKIGFVTIRKKFLRVLSTSLMIIFLIVVGNLLVSILTLFAGLILTLPITYLIICLFKIITFYESNGMRYYVGDTIRTPLKKEEQDKFNKLKYIL